MTSDGLSAIPVRQVTTIRNARPDDLLATFHQGTDAGMIKLVGEDVFIDETLFAQMTPARPWRMARSGAGASSSPAMVSGPSTLRWIVSEGCSPAGGVTGTLPWIKPRSSFYPDGFAAERDAMGSRFTRITAGTPALSSPDGDLQFYAGNLLSAATNENTLSPTAKPPSSAGPIQRRTFVVNPRNGRFSGQFLHPVSLRTNYYCGVLLQNCDLGGKVVPVAL